MDRARERVTNTGLHLEGHSYPKVMFRYNCISVSVCLYLRISLTAELIGFSLTGMLLIGPGKVYSYFGGGYDHPPERNCPLEINYAPPPKKKKSELKMGFGI